MRTPQYFSCIFNRGRIHCTCWRALQSIPPRKATRVAKPRQHSTLQSCPFEIVIHHRRDLVLRSFLMSRPLLLLIPRIERSRETAAMTQNQSNYAEQLSTSHTSRKRVADARLRVLFQSPVTIVAILFSASFSRRDHMLLHIPHGERSHETTATIDTKQLH